MKINKLVLEVTMSNKNVFKEIINDFKEIMFDIIIPLIPVLLSLGLSSLILWVIVHFIIKFW